MNSDLSRVIVIGTSGVGKTTYARALSDVLGIPHIELDAIFWGPDWTPRDRDTFRALVELETAADQWILDGNYSAIRDIVWPRASAVVWLNYSFALVFWRVLKRTLQRIVTREELFGGNVESFRTQFFSRQSLLWWVITSYSRRRRQYRHLFDSWSYASLLLIELKNPKHAQEFLTALAHKRNGRDANGTH